MNGISQMGMHWNSKRRGKQPRLTDEAEDLAFRVGSTSEVHKRASDEQKRRKLLHRASWVFEDIQVVQERREMVRFVRRLRVPSDAELEAGLTFSSKAATMKADPCTYPTTGSYLIAMKERKSKLISFCSSPS